MTALQNAMNTLPAAAVAGELDRALEKNPAVIVSAPPGAGKSTLLPITLMNGLRGQGKILVLEPRRIAARQIASRMADLLEEPVGKTVGYRVRFEGRVSKDTRIEVITEGILTRMLVDDPTLDGVAVVIFDEFHERSLTSDLDLALTRQAQSLVRDDLKIVVMSATIDTGSLADQLGAPVISSQGRMFPVKVIHADIEATPQNAAEATAHVIRRAHRDNEGDILAFLPGEADIRRCEELLEGAFPETDIYPLYGQLPVEKQKAAIAPSPDGRRKIVLATPVAETSLTIEGVRVVVDSGLARRLEFSAQNGLSHLVTERISMDMAQQRTGRAGRVSEGICYRLWSTATEARMKQFRTPELLEADLSPMTLDIAAWGENDPLSLDWLTPPPAAHVAKAKDLLVSLGAITGNGITHLGRRMSSLSCHPRIAGMLIAAKDMGLTALASDIAAILEERDPMSQTEGTSFHTRICELRRLRSQHRAYGIWDRIERIAQQYRKMMGGQEDNSIPDAYACGDLLSRAYPERIAKSQDAPGRFTLSGGGCVTLDISDEMSSHDWIVAAGVSAGSRSDGRVFLAAPLEQKSLGWAETVRDNISWDSKAGCLVARRERRIGVLTVASSAISDLPRDKAVQVICRAAAKDGLGMFDFNDSVQNLQRRISAVRMWHPEEDIPEVSTETLLDSADEWLPLYIGKAASAQELKKIDMCQVIWGLLPYEKQALVDMLAPTHLEVPTGSRIRIEYRTGAEAPVLRVRLQECFGLMDTPRVDAGRLPVLMELLSPGFKPVQLTSDLRSFWNETYFEVRKELKRRYPKHSWPDDPASADPTRGVRRK